ncbi:MAG: hypothetical protein GWN58_16375 [Anaerolineae bacterium]|nr:hypothetical protein [Anaerolineae bacterium]
MSTGLRCPNCGFTTTNIPESDVARLRMPSATVTCPKCRQTHPAADCWTAYEKWQADRRQGLKLQYRRN